ncbi:AAA family ATPase [Synechococcus elongatus]|uniref:AAA family ATPase n=1 Tax=Synechococcus elongatus TaxID=32046 RepID=UPI000F7F5A5F|nr:AAA family ATPase [Synechococcus elongatus]
MQASVAPHLRFRLSVNRSWTGKPNPEKVNLAKGWQEADFDLPDLRQHIEAGFAVNSALLAGSRRSNEAFISSQLVFVDIDNKDPKTEGWSPQLSIAQALELPIVRDHAAYLYYSPSHRANWERFRIVWIAPIPIDDRGVYSDLVNWIYSQIPGIDTKTSSVTNLFYGSTYNAKVEPPLFIERSFPLDWIDLADDWARERAAAKKREPLRPVRTEPIHGDVVDLKNLLGAESTRILAGDVGDRSDAAMKLLLDFQGCENWCATNGVPFANNAIEEWDAACREIYKGEKEKFIADKIDRLINSCTRGHGDPETWESSIVSMYGNDGLWKRVKALYPSYRDRSNYEAQLSQLLDDDCESVMESNIALLPGVEPPVNGDEIVRRFKDLEAFIGKTVVRRGLPTVYKLALIRERADELKLRRLLKEDELVRVISKVAQQQRGGRVGPIFPGDRVQRPVILPDLIQNLLPARNLTLLTGPPKAAKTSFAVGMIKALLGDRPQFLGMETRFTGTVVWICDDQAEEDTFLQSERAGLYNHPRLITWHNWTLDDLGDLEDLLHDPRVGPNPLVVIDSLTSVSRNSGIDENSPAMGFALYELKETLSALGATTLLIHHSNKAGVGLNSVRGSTAITGAAANVLSINLLTKRVDGVNIEDRDNPRRRISASMRRSSMADCLVEINFQDLSVEYIATWDEWSQQQKEQSSQEEADEDEVSNAVLRFLQNSSDPQSKSDIARGVLGTDEIRTPDNGHTREARLVYRKIDKLLRQGLIMQGVNERRGLYSCDPDKLQSRFNSDDVEFD